MRNIYLTVMLYLSKINLKEQKSSSFIRNRMYSSWMASLPWLKGTL